MPDKADVSGQGVNLGGQCLAEGSASSMAAEVCVPANTAAGPDLVAKMAAEGEEPCFSLLGNMRGGGGVHTRSATGKARSVGECRNKPWFQDEYNDETEVELSCSTSCSVRIWPCSPMHIVYLGFTKTFDTVPHKHFIYK